MRGEQSRKKPIHIAAALIEIISAYTGRLYSSINKRHATKHNRPSSTSFVTKNYKIFHRRLNKFRSTIESSPLTMWFHLDCRYFFDVV